ncbi:hypothetical protein C8R45DRAFT_260564 [Mycena sanguinolenta]|nr:hypothetical protein C8R45DRAFT_260564 [Mycena sanguinolenta]
MAALRALLCHWAGVAHLPVVPIQMNKIVRIRKQSDERQRQYVVEYVHNCSPRFPVRFTGSRVTARQDVGLLEWIRTA